MKRPFYGERISSYAIAALCFGVLVVIVTWCAIFQAVRGLL